MLFFILVAGESWAPGLGPWPDRTGPSILGMSLAVCIVGEAWRVGWDPPPAKLAVFAVRVRRGIDPLTQVWAVVSLFPSEGTDRVRD